MQSHCHTHGIEAPDCLRRGRLAARAARRIAVYKQDLAITVPDAATDDHRLAGS
jgi:hypothetical protein